MGRRFGKTRAAVAARRFALAASVLFASAGASAAEPLCSLDIDGNGEATALTDGLLLIRHLFGFSGTTLTDGAIGGGCSRCTGSEITAHLDTSACRTLFDADGDGDRTALTDGLLVIRHLFGFSGPTLTDGAVNEVGCTRCTAEGIVAHLNAPVAPEDEVFTGGEAYSPDDGLRTTTFSSITSTQVGLAARVASSIDGMRWLSQYTSACDSATENGFCGFASVLMGADYLLGGNTSPPAPATLGHGGDADDWLLNSVAEAFGATSSYANCGGPVGIYYDDIPRFASALGLAEAARFDGLNAEAEFWIATALSNDLPVLALVPYQGRTCSGRNAVSQADYYAGGALTRTMMPCASSPYRHWVVLAGMDADSVLVYDPDPFADSDAAGIRRYSKSSFFSVLPDTRPGRNGLPVLFKLCATADDCDQDLDAFTTVARVELLADTLYRADQVQPVVTPLVSPHRFSATGLPAGLSLDTEGRIIGLTSVTGQFTLTVTMVSTLGGITRQAEQTLELIVSRDAAAAVPPRFAIASNLPVATVGYAYQLPIGMQSLQTPISFRLLSGALPIGLRLVSGAIAGVPEHTGTWTFELDATTDAGSTMKQFSVDVDAAAQPPTPDDPPQLTGIREPTPIYGKQQKQPVTFSGSGFENGDRIVLYDVTNNECPYDKNAEWLSASELRISAGFTTEQADWSATVVDTHGQVSNTLAFTVESGGNVNRPARWKATRNPPVAGELKVNTDYGAFSRGCANADESQVYTYYLEDPSVAEHLGLDLKAPLGTAVYPIAPGKVLHSGPLASWGLKWKDVVLVEHWTTSGETFTAVYGHLDADAKWSAGASVTITDRLGTTATLAAPSAPHLHFGIARGRHVSVPGSVANDCVSSPDVTVDPETFLEQYAPSPTPPAAVAAPDAPAT